VELAAAALRFLHFRTAKAVGERMILYVFPERHSLLDHIFRRQHVRQLRQDRCDFSPSDDGSQRCL
jgi:hypothetical protein